MFSIALTRAAALRLHSHGLEVPATQASMTLWSLMAVLDSAACDGTPPSADLLAYLVVLEYLVYCSLERLRLEFPGPFVVLDVGVCAMCEVVTRTSRHTITVARVGRRV
jgi:hypothetical protein